eukprot:TRINITY_DN35852_c0_g1_i1.p1 TRINITY_DN35852_c0_g1~~TRINITY_DN35852_c0_g1_i1.p1  ORF type:complete len:225 (+),score=19.86 TRINITY_DN35852_c0_g1_i1:205-879(+)
MAEAYWRSSRFGETLKRNRAEYEDTFQRNRAEYDPLAAGFGREIRGYVPRDDFRLEEERRRLMRETDPVGSAYDRYVRNDIKSYSSVRASGDLSRGLPPVSDTSFRDLRFRSSFGRSEDYFAAEGSSTLFVEGFPSDSTQREAAHIFRPFVGYKELRLVKKDPKRPGGDPVVICFVDFSSPSYAASAMEALQGYKLDEKDDKSPRLKLQISRFPGNRRGGDFRV